MARQEKANCTLVFQNQSLNILPDLDDEEEDESYVPSEPDAEMEYELPDPRDDDDDPGDDGDAHIEIQGVAVVLCEPLCYFGDAFLGNWWSGGSPSIPMIGVSPTNLSKELSAQSYGTLMTSRSHTLTPQWWMK